MIDLEAIRARNVKMRASCAMLAAESARLQLGDPAGVYSALIQPCDDIDALLAEVERLVAHITDPSALWVGSYD